jgi:hypothetical protein
MALGRMQSALRSLGVLLLLVAVPAVFYARTMAPGLTWEHHGYDGGDLAAAVASGGIPHPTGYPTYLLLGRLFARLPVGVLAWRLNLMSAVCALGSVGCVYLLARRLLVEMELAAPPICAVGCASPARILPSWLVTAVSLAGSWIWALSPLLWSQAVITEVYTLHVLLVGLLLYLSLGQGRQSRKNTAWRWLLLGLVTGLGLGNHLTFGLLVAILASGQVWAGPSRLLGGRRGVTSSFFGLLLGLSVYLYLPWATRQAGAYLWGQADTWAGFFWLVSGGPYRQFVFGMPLVGVLGRLSAVAGSLLEQYGLIGVALGLAGVALVWQRKRRWTVMGLAICAVVIVYSVGYNTSDAQVYLLPAYLLAASAVALGWGSLLVWLWQRWPRLSLGVALAGLVLVLAVGWLRLPEMDVHSDNTAVVWGREVLSDLPRDSMAISREDGQTFTLAYFQVVEGMRPDVVLVDADLLGYDWYRHRLTARHPGLQGAQTLEALAGRNPERPVVEISGLPGEDR